MPYWCPTTCSRTSAPESLMSVCQCAKSALPGAGITTALKTDSFNHFRVTLKPRQRLVFYASPSATSRSGSPARHRWWTMACWHFSTCAAFAQSSSRCLGWLTSLIAIAVLAFGAQHWPDTTVAIALGLLGVSLHQPVPLTWLSRCGARTDTVTVCHCPSH